MGRIDGDLMYSIVKEWDWGNSNSPDIYHDPETRKNSINYRGNLARLVEQLLNEDKKEKAKEILDLAMEKMPFGYFGYYVFLEPYVDGYYKVGEKEKARDLYYKLAKKYQENLEYYSSLDIMKQRTLGSEIITDIERYRSLIDIVVVNGDKDVAVDEASKFNQYLELFPHFYREPQPEETVEDMFDSIIEDTIVQDSVSVSIDGIDIEEKVPDSVVE